MKYLLVSLIFCICGQAFGSPYLVREWTRNTLAKPHYFFRHQNRMTPLLTETRVVQGNAIDGIKVFDRQTGNEVWSMVLTNGVEGGAAIDDGKLYFGSNNGNFYCVDVNSGREIWTFKLNSESLTRPVIQGRYVYHVTGNNTLYAFDKATGETLWVKTNSAKANMTVRGQTAPVYEKGILYLGFSDGVFAAINAQNGRELWSKRIGDDKKFNDVDATAVISNKCLLVSSFANSLYCLDKTSGTIRWRHDVGGFNSVYLDNDKVYYSNVNSEIDVLDAESGKLLKKIVSLKGVATEIAGLGPYIVYGESEGALVVRDKATLNKVTSFSPGLGLFAKPMIDPEKNQIYFVSNDANLYRVDLKTRKDNVFPWSPDQNEN